MDLFDVEFQELSSMFGFPISQAGFHIKGFNRISGELLSAHPPFIKREHTSFPFYKLISLRSKNFLEFS